MRKRSIGVLGATIAAAVTLVPAATAGQTFGSEINLVSGQTFPDDRYALFGTVESPRARCESNRVVKLLISANASGPLEVVDVDRTSANGVFGVSFSLDKDLERVRLRATLKRLRPTKTCTAVSEPVTF